MLPHGGHSRRHFWACPAPFEASHLHEVVRFAPSYFLSTGWELVPKLSQSTVLGMRSALFLREHPQDSLKEVSMRWSSITICAFLVVAPFFVVVNASAQSQEEEMGTLPVLLSNEQLQSLQQLSPAVSPIGNPERAQPRARRRLPMPVLPLTVEETSYRDAVRKLGIDKHRFVHCELYNGKVRTGVITQISYDGFMLRDGIILAQWIPYTDLKAAPRPVPAVGTRIGQGFKWTGLVVGCVAAIPFVAAFYPLVLLGAIQD
jgi:hypothetical protein